VLAGCSRKPPLNLFDEEQSYSALVQQYNDGDYQDAVDGLNFYTLNFSGSGKVDSAQFLLGQAQFKLKEYLVAAASFEELINRFPSSPLVADAMYMIGESYWKMSPKYNLDQEYTDRAVNALQSFIEFYPEQTEKVNSATALILLCREKLAHKTYHSGLIYLKMKDYAAAAIYFRDVMELYYDTTWKVSAQYQLGMALMGDKLYDEAITAFRQFIDDNVDHELIGKARRNITKSQNLFTASTKTP